MMLCYVLKIHFMEVIENRMKKIIVEIPDDLHQKFKSVAYKKGKTIKKIILPFIELFVKDAEKNEKKNK